MSAAPGSLDDLSALISKCRICCDEPSGGMARALPHEPRPVCVASSTARVLIAGQAPGVRVHASGRPFTDPSGDRLRAWLNVDEVTFYDPGSFAIVPMGFCFPGLDAKGSDLPRRRECAQTWRKPLMQAMPEVRLILAVGQYAHRWHLGDLCGKTLTQTVANWREIIATTASVLTASDRANPCIFPLPHPSWRNSMWLKRNPWFETDLLPVLQDKVKRQLARQPLE